AYARRRSEEHAASPAHGPVCRRAAAAVLVVARRHWRCRSDLWVVALAPLHRAEQGGCELTSLVGEDVFRPAGRSGSGTTIPRLSWNSSKALSRDRDSQDQQCPALPDQTERSSTPHLDSHDQAWKYA